MTIVYTCPRCKTMLRAPEEMAGTKHECSSCGQRLQIPPRPAGPPLNKTVLAKPVETHKTILATEQPPSPPALPKSTVLSQRSPTPFTKWLIVAAGSGTVLILALSVIMVSWFANGPAGSTPHGDLSAKGQTPTTPPKNEEPVVSELDKLHAERLELERQRAEIERQKREALEKQLRDKQAAEKAHEYDPEEFRSLKDLIERIADSLGMLLLSGTHPTGIYGSTAVPVVTLSSDRREITISVTIHWKGGVSETPYVTTFSANLNKKEGVGTLKVLRDNAFFSIKPGFLRNTESSLRDMFKSLR